MIDNKKDYKIGLAYYFALMVCISSFYMAPDGDTLLYKLLGLFGISPGIRLGANSTLYIYMFIPLILGFIFIKGIFRHWWGYGYRFSGFGVFLRYLPVLIAVVVFFASSAVDTAYYSFVRNADGLDAIVYYSPPENSEPLSYSYDNGGITYDYDITLQNYGDKTQSFQIMHVDNWDFGEVLIRLENGEPAVFSLAPGHRQRFTGGFAIAYETNGSSGSGSCSQPTFVLRNEKERNAPSAIKKLPKRGFWQ